MMAETVNSRRENLSNSRRTSKRFQEILDINRENFSLEKSEIFGKSQKLAWPVDVYRVTFPEPLGRSRELNVFERLILQMIERGGFREEPLLSEKTQLPIDLVHLILMRLRDRGIIDSENLLIRRDVLEEDSWEKISPITALFFRELCTGQMLPIFYTLDSKSPFQKKPLKGREHFALEPNDNYPPPSTREILSVLKKVKRRLKIEGNDNYSIPPERTINIVNSNEPENYYLELEIAIRKIDGEFQIADPFGRRAIELERSFEKLLAEKSEIKNWFLKWQDSLVQVQEQDGEAERQHSRALYDTPKNRSYYPYLIKTLESIEGSGQNSLQQLYAALEWAIFYHIYIHTDFHRAVFLLKNAQSLERSEIIERAAQKVGLSYPRQGLYPPTEEKLKKFLRGEAELITLLAISLLSAEEIPHHPMRKISNKYPNFLEIILGLKRKRDKIAHGKESKIGGEENFIKEIISIFLPTIQFSSRERTSTMEGIEDIYLEAKVNIQKRFGFRLYNVMDAHVRERLIDVERFVLSLGKNRQANAQAFISDIYGALQKLFSKKILENLPAKKDYKKPLEEAGEIAKRVGLGALPRTLRTVKGEALRKTLQGRDQTLGASVLAYILLAEREELEGIAQKYPSLLKDIAKVIEKRGHGNKPVNLDRTEITKYKSKAYQIIEILLEE